jgi:hypothetical protein
MGFPLSLRERGSEGVRPFMEKYLLKKSDQRKRNKKIKYTSHNR